MTQLCFQFLCWVIHLNKVLPAFHHSMPATAPCDDTTHHSTLCATGSPVTFFTNTGTLMQHRISDRAICRGKICVARSTCVFLTGASYKSLLTDILHFSPQDVPCFRAFAATLLYAVHVFLCRAVRLRWPRPCHISGGFCCIVPKNMAIKYVCHIVWFPGIWP